MTKEQQPSDPFPEHRAPAAPGTSTAEANDAPPRDRTTALVVAIDEIRFSKDCLVALKKSMCQPLEPRLQSNLLWNIDSSTSKTLRILDAAQNLKDLPPANSEQPRQPKQINKHHFRRIAFNMAPFVKSIPQWSLLLALAARCDDGGKVRIAQQTLANATAQSRRSVRSHLAALAHQHLVHSKNNGRFCSFTSSSPTKTYILDLVEMRRAARSCGKLQPVNTTFFPHFTAWASQCPNTTSLAVLITVITRMNSNFVWDKTENKYVQRESDARTGMTDMAIWFGCDRRTISSALRRLREAGLLEFHAGQGCGNTTQYEISPAIIESLQPGGPD
jgi:DNA-binding transcriptional ArsR family regulator